MVELVPTICPYCSCGCGFYLVLKDGRIVGEEPWKAHPLNEGANCIKGRRAFKFLYREDRLKKPLIREGGRLREASWDEALGLAAERLKEFRGKSFGLIASGRGTNEDSYILQKFARVVMGTNNIDYCARFCHSTTVAGLLPSVGSGVMQTSITDLDLADCFILFGVNIKETFPLISRRVLRARRRGAKVIAVDPRKTPTARYLADIHLQLKPGSDVALINGMMKAILEEGKENREFISSRTSGFEGLKEYLASLSWESVEGATGLSRELIKEAALLYAGAERGCILYDEGITQHWVGGDNVRNLANLALITGHIGKPGTGVNSMRGQINGEGTGDMGCLNVFYPGFQRVGDETAKKFEELWGVEGLPREPGFTYLDIIGKCRAVYIVGANPMVAAPDISNIRSLLENLDLLIVQDIFLTETAELAHIVFPAATWVEREGTHTWIDRRVQRVEKVIEPPGEAKPDWWITCEIAKRMGYGDKFNFGSPEEIFEEIRKAVPQYRGITYARLKKPGGIQWPCPSEDHPGTPTMFTERFNTPDGRGQIQPVEYKPPAEVPDDEYPFYLTTGRLIFHYHTGTMTRRTDDLHNETPECFVEVNPKDAERDGIREGDRVRVETRRGRLELPARVTDEVPEGVLFIPFHFGDRPANLLTNPALDPGARMPEFKVCAARLIKGG